MFKNRDRGFFSTLFHSTQLSSSVDFFSFCFNVWDFLFVKKRKINLKKKNPVSISSLSFCVL